MVNGLEALAGKGVTKVLIHDIARPGLTERVIDDVIAALDIHQGAAPALPVVDALWIGADGWDYGVVYLLRGDVAESGCWVISYGQQRTTDSCQGVVQYASCVIVPPDGVWSQWVKQIVGQTAHSVSFC